MPEDEPDNVVEIAAPKSGWSSCKMPPYPDHVKELIKGMWMNGMQPAKIAERINEGGFLSKPVHPNSISQFLSQERRKNPKIAETREETIKELNEAAVDAVATVKGQIIGAIKESTMIVAGEVVDRLPKVIRNVMEHLEDCAQDDDPKTVREYAITLKMLTDMLSKLGGIDLAQRVAEFRGKRLVDLEFDGPKESDLKNATPAVVEIEGWDIGRKSQ